MSEPLVRETVLIVGDRTYRVREDDSEAPRTLVVTVAVDESSPCTFREPGWQPICLGVFENLVYIWSARSLITLPQVEDVTPEVTRLDEDLLSVFHDEKGWVMVCETSLRRHVNGHETDRLEFGEVIEHVHWQGGWLWVRDAAGKEHRERVVGERFLR